MIREEQIIQAARNAERETTFNPIVKRAKGVNSAFGIGFLEGAQWANSNLWKPADGDDLPEIDREVIVLVKALPEHEDGLLKVAFGHRPSEYWDGKNILTGEVTRYYPKRYDKGGWNIQDVKWWLDIDLPKMEE